MPLPLEVNSEVSGHVEFWRPNHVYAFGAVVSYDDTRYVGMGYLNNLQPNSPLMELPFVVPRSEYDGIEGGVREGEAAQGSHYRPSHCYHSNVRAYDRQPLPGACFALF